MEAHRENRRCGNEISRSRKNKKFFEEFEFDLKERFTPGGILYIEDASDPKGAYVIIDLKKKFLKRIFVEERRRGRNAGEFLFLKMLKTCKIFGIDKLTFWNVNEGFWHAMSCKYSFVLPCKMADYGCIILKEELRYEEKS